MNRFNPKFKTTFWQDFTDAETNGIIAICDLWKKTFQENKCNVVNLTELVIVLNWKLWDHFYHDESNLVHVYDGLWKKTHKYAISYLKDDELSYYLREVD